MLPPNTVESCLRLWVRVPFQVNFDRDLLGNWQRQLISRIGWLSCWEGLVLMLRHFNFCIRFFLIFLNLGVCFSPFCCHSYPSTVLRAGAYGPDARFRCWLSCYSLRQALEVRRWSYWSLVNCTFRKHCRASGFRLLPDICQVIIISRVMVWLSSIFEKMKAGSYRGCLSLRQGGAVQMDHLFLL